MAWRIAEWRLYRCLNQAELARNAGISRTTLHGIENGLVTNPHPKTITALARELQCDEAHLQQLPKETLPESVQERRE